MKSLFKRSAIILCVLTAIALCTLAVSAATSGDLDNDGVVDTDDAIYLLMHTFFLQIIP